MSNSVKAKEGCLCYIPLGDSKWIGEILSISPEGICNLLVFPIYDSYKEANDEALKNASLVRSSMSIHIDKIELYNKEFHYPVQLIEGKKNGIKFIDVVSDYCDEVLAHFVLCDKYEEEIKIIAKNMVAQLNKEYRHEKEVEMIKDYLNEQT